jgi:shikimate dehydrogenase
MDRYYVLGNPVEHSRSPYIHRFFADALHQKLSYEARLVPLDAFEQTVEGLKKEHFSGCNITVPFKEQAYRIADDLTARAEFAGAVNTLKYENGRLLGDNTDGEGLVTDLMRCGVALAGARILVLGAGGAARGILAPLLERNPSELVIANRTVQKAEVLAEHVKSIAGCSVRGTGYDQPKGHFDLVINATSSSISNNIPPLPADTIDSSTRAYDLMYSPVDTVFVTYAKSKGAEAWDGLGMLVCQAAESFFLWRGVRPETEELIRKLRSDMKK